MKITPTTVSEISTDDIMRKVYDSYILKFEGVSGPSDHEKLHHVLQSSRGSVLILRVHQDKKRIEIQGLIPNLLEVLKENNINPNLPFDAEVISRMPDSVGVRPIIQQTRSYVDKNDFNHLQWNGTRGKGRVTTNGLRGTPMFFRENGSNLDLHDLFDGMPLFLVLNGQSFNSVDRSILSKPGIMTFGVNNGAHGFRPNFWTCVDDPTRFMRSIWEDPKITKFVPMAHFQKHIWNNTENSFSKEQVMHFPNVIGYRRNETFVAANWLHENTINWGRHANLGGGRSVMLVALRIAYLLGFRKVYLVGCDFFMDAQKKYWFEEDRPPNAIKNNQNTYRILSEYFEELLPYFKEAEFQVINCTPSSRLKIFPFMRFEDAIANAEVCTATPTQGMYVDRFKSVPAQSDKTRTV